ncbi:hypothetical protein [Polaromonas sp. YR568]|uniref:hypothetical protein n=1 Tax=Polaromonas sp. YR568 TaxID=1855301 RepID=UPI0031379EA5
MKYARLVTGLRIYRSEPGQTTKANAVFKKTPTGVGQRQQTVELWKKDYKKYGSADLY